MMPRAQAHPPKLKQHEHQEADAAPSHLHPMQGTTRRPLTQAQQALCVLRESQSKKLTQKLVSGMHQKKLDNFHNLKQRDSHRETEKPRKDACHHRAREEGRVSK